MNRAATKQGQASAAPARGRVRLGTAPRPGRAPGASLSSPATAVRPDAGAPARWEWVLAVGALFVLGRSPILFLRQRSAELLGLPVSRIWQDDWVLRGIFGAVVLAVVVVAVLKVGPHGIVRQPALLAFLCVVVLSTAWSVEPTVTPWRAALFIGAAGVGWYIGDRFSISDQITIVACLAAVAAAASLTSFGLWPQFATSTGVVGAWSGVYVNRNLLGHIMCLGLLAAPFVWTRLDPIRRAAIVILAGVEVILLVGSGSRTGPVAVLAALWAAALVFAVRGIGRGNLNARAGAAVCVGIGVMMGFLVHRSWPTIVTALGRRTDLTSRTLQWAVDRQLIRLRPWQGWGFEAIWTHDPTIRLARDTSGVFPFSSHNGYYEILLGVGAIGFTIFIAFLLLAAMRAFRFAWRRDGVEALWPLAIIVFGAVVNFSESFFVSTEATWALVVAAAVATTRRTATAVGGRRLSLSVSDA